MEGVLPMVHRARENAERNGLTNVRFFQCDLAAPFTDMPWAKERFGLVLLDPARAWRRRNYSAFIEVIAPAVGVCLL